LASHGTAHPLLSGGRRRKVAVPNVLIVDGDPTARTVLNAAIARAGLSVDAVATLEEARGLLAHAAFDVVLLELELPDGHGFDLLRELRGRHVAAIVVSSMHQHAHIARSRTFGAVDYVTKPFSPSDVVARVLPLFPKVAA